MKECKEITAVEYIGAYNLCITFRHGEKRIYNAEKLVNTDGQFAFLKDIDKFKKCYISDGAVAWDNGTDMETDICPDKMYMDSKPI